MSIKPFTVRKLPLPRQRSPALLSGLAIAVAALLAGCQTRIETTVYALDLPRLDGAAGTPISKTTVIDLHELFASEERLVYDGQEIPVSLREVRVLAIDGRNVPRTARYGEINSGHHVFHLTIKTTSHKVLDHSLTSAKPPGGKSLETREIVARRRLALDLKPHTLVGFDAEGRYRIVPISGSVFGPEGSCRREGDRDRLCHKCTREQGTASCIRELHREFYSSES